MKSKFIKFIIRHMPIIIFTIYIVIIHSKVLNNIGDDLWFSSFKNQSLLEIAINRYMNWTSRFILDTCLFIFNAYIPNIWLVLDILFCYLIYYSLNKLLNRENNQYIKYIIVLLFILYPFIDMGSAGWKTTTIVYLWPLSLGLYAFTIINSNMKGEKVNKIQIILATISLVIATNQEQLCVLSTGFLSLYILYDYIYNKKIRKLNIAYLIICILMLTNHLLCPGNEVRAILSVETSFPEFNNISIFTKLSLGINTTYEMLLGHINYIFITMLILILILLIKNKSNKKYIITSSILLILSIVIPYLDIFNAGNNYGGYLCDTLQDCPLVLQVIGYNSKRYLLSIVISLIYTVSIIWLLYKIFENDKLNKYFIPIIFLAAILSKMILAFSATIFISGYRTGIFMYFLIIIINVILIKRSKFNSNSLKNIIKVLLLFTIISYISYLHL